MGEMMQHSRNRSSSLKLMNIQGEDPDTMSSYKDDTGEEGESESGFKCRWIDCGLWFNRLELLATHVTQIHAVSGSGGLFYCGWEGCSRGDKGFNARYKMLVHVRTHTNEKPHRCFKCDKSFSRAENLKIHARSHTGEKPYVCPVEGCGKAYSNSSDRFKHTRTHSVDKPYVCKIAGCPKRYTDPSSLRKHVKTYKHFPTTNGDLTSNEGKSSVDTNTKNRNSDNVLSQRNVIVQKNNCDSFLSENVKNNVKLNKYDDTDMHIPKKIKTEDFPVLSSSGVFQSDDNISNVRGPSLSPSESSSASSSSSDYCSPSKSYLSSHYPMNKFWDSQYSHPIVRPWFGADLAIMSHSFPFGLQYWSPPSAFHRGNMTRAHEHNITPLGLTKAALYNCASSSEQILPLDLTVKAACKN